MLWKKVIYDAQAKACGYSFVLFNFFGIALLVPHVLVMMNRDISHVNYDWMR